METGRAEEATRGVAAGEAEKLLQPSLLLDWFIRTPGRRSSGTVRSSGQAAFLDEADLICAWKAM